MKCEKYPLLFEPTKIGNIKLKNRIAMSAMGTGFANHDGTASDRIIRYYEERAKGGAGLIFTEICRIDGETGLGNFNQLGAYEGYQMKSLRSLTEAVHRHDTKIFLQLHHPGRVAQRLLLGGKQAVAPSAIPDKVVAEMPRELTTEECEALVKKFCVGAYIAKAAGFDGIELHAAHGYLINQFMSPYSNKRTDKYGGNFIGRMRFITEIILGIRYQAAPGFPICVKIDGDEFVEGGMGLEEWVKIARYLENLGVSCLDVSCGIHETGYTIIEPNCYKEGWKKNLAKTIKENVKIPVIAVNTVKHAGFAEQLLEEGVSDIVSCGRAFLADPNWPVKARCGQENLTRKCIACVHCFAVASTGCPIECTINPQMGRENLYGDDKLARDGAGRKVAVIGGGPAGMQAALVLKKRGFEPVLFESGSKLGGTMNLADQPPHKELMAEFIDTMSEEMRHYGIEVRLNTKATVEEIKKLNPYGVFVACGGKPIVPSVPGIRNSNVYLYKDILDKSVVLKGKNVAVIGGGDTGLEVADYLCADNCVSVIEMRNDVGTDLFRTAKLCMLRRLEEAHVDIVTGKALKEVTDTGIILEDSFSGVRTSRDADALVLALGISPDETATKQFEDAFDKVVFAGNSEAGGTIAEAIRHANDKAFVF